MPELPEVEAARRAIEENCLGKKIKRSVIAVDSKVIDGVSPSDFEASLTGKTILAAHRKGKNMWIQLDSPPFPSFQFGMAGAIYIKGVAVTKYKRSAVNDTDEWPSKYSKLFIELDDGLELSFTDKRRFAKVRLLENPASVPPVSELGPDALLEAMTEDELFKSLGKKKIGIKALLLDQSFISGVGNWIADEVLYQARIHPLQNAASILKEGCAALHNSLKEVIEKAVEVGADSSQFPSNWIFHSREKKPGKAFVDGKKIGFISAGGRTTAYVPELQKLSGDQAAKAPVEPQKRSSKKSKDKADEPESEDEEIIKSAKPKGGQKTTQSRAKKPPAKSKSNRSDDADDDVDQMVQTKDGKIPATRKKSNENIEVDEPQMGSRGSRGNKGPPAWKKSQESETDSENVSSAQSQFAQPSSGNLRDKGKKRVRSPDDSEEQEFVPEAVWSVPLEAPNGPEDGGDNPFDQLLSKYSYIVSACLSSSRKNDVLSLKGEKLMGQALKYSAMFALTIWRLTKELGSSLEDSKQLAEANEALDLAEGKIYVLEAENKGLNTKVRDITWECLVEKASRNEVEKELELQCKQCSEQAKALKQAARVHEADLALVDNLRAQLRAKGEELSVRDNKLRKTKEEHISLASLFEEYAVDMTKIILAQHPDFDFSFDRDLQAAASKARSRMALD